MDSMEPTEYFTPQTITWCQSIGSKATKVSQHYQHDASPVRSYPNITIYSFGYLGLF